MIDDRASPSLTGRMVREEVHTTASSDRVWEAWTNPARLREWLVDLTSGQPATGGTWTWIWKPLGLAVSYRVEEAIPTSRLVLSSTSANRGATEIRIRPHDDSTAVAVIDTALPDDPEEVGAIGASWRSALAVMKAYVEEHFGRPRETFSSVREGVFPLDALSDLTSHPGSLTRWLGESSGIGPAGQPYAVDLIDGGRMSGRVLARSRRGFVLGWEEIGGLVEARVFLGESGRSVIAATGSAWDSSPERARSLEPLLERALARLVGVLEGR